jgi:hypothetical protein
MSFDKFNEISPEKLKTKFLLISLEIPARFVALTRA